MNTKRETIEEFTKRVMSECRFDVPPILNQEEEFKQLISEPLFLNYSKERFKRIFYFVMKER